MWNLGVAAGLCLGNGMLHIVQALDNPPNVEYHIIVGSLELFAAFFIWRMSVNRQQEA